MMLEISRALLARIAGEAAANPAHEICGLLLGEGHRVTAIRPSPNVSPEPESRFEIDPAVLIGAHRDARSGGPVVVGCYHSHPSGSAIPSPRDAADAAPDGQYWLIVADGEVRGWRAGPGGVLHGRFDPVDLVTR